MMKKILIPILIMCSLFAISANTVIAADFTREVADPTGDVYDSYGDSVTTSENINVDDIDIVKLTYSKEGKTATLTLQVNGNILNKGQLDDLYSIFDMDKDINLVMYTLTLITSGEQYIIYYVNNECNLSYGSNDESVNLRSFYVSGDTLRVTFDLNGEEETYDSMSAETAYEKIPDLSGYDIESMTEEDIANLDIEELYDEVADESDDGSNNNGGDDTNGDTDTGDGGQESSNNVLILFVAVIAFIAVAGVAVIVYIIRR